jgi:fructose 1,6-bisphosphatase
MTFSEWRSLGITQVIFEEFKHRVEQALQELEYTAGQDSLKDRFTAGRLASYREFLEMAAEDFGDKSHGN